MSNSTSPKDVFTAHDARKTGWTPRDATHLLWRAQYGASIEEIERATEVGLEGTLERLLSPQSESPEFVSSERLLRQVALDTGNIDNLKAWWLYRMLNSANPLVEKMSLFWHNHFATSHAKVQSVKHMGVQNDLIRTEAIGSFRKLLNGMTRDVAMLIWLDGNANRKRHANENFAREVMELFSLGEGNYTEQDIVQAAKAFTGWHVRDGTYWFNKRQHDDGQKTVLGRTGEFDGDDVIEICLTQAACPRFLAGKLLSAFVTSSPDKSAVEQLAARIRVHDYQMTPVLRELFGSRLFFGDAARHAIFKSPLELVLGTYRALESRPNLPSIVRLLAELGQDVFEPPTVKGWEGGRLWINSATLLQRANFAAEITSGTRFGEIADPETIATTRSLNAPADVVRHYANLLVARDIPTESEKQLTEYLDDAEGRRPQRIRGLIHLVLCMPEYQLV
jgi:uncharacterized protein (DUF1800 family)